ncbi:hypothetical protein CR513_54790, partial [Mucuna pruriens]
MDLHLTREQRSKEKDHDDDNDDRVTTAIGDNLVSNESIGATLHVTLRKEFFTSYTSGDFGVLKMGNDGVTKTRVSFKKHPPLRKVELLELVHFDVCGPLKALVERQSDKKVKYIRYDNDDEYYGPFDVYCKQQGIKHEKTPPKTPQLNDLTKRMNKSTFVGYSDSDMARDINSRKFTSGYLIKFVGGVVAWQYKLQKCVALSTIKAEFIAITEAYKELLWVKKFFEEFGFVQDKYLLFCDRSKHIDMRYHWICDALDAKLLELAKVHTDDNDADIMTKALPRGKFLQVKKIYIRFVIASLHANLNCSMPA